MTDPFIIRTTKLQDLQIIRLLHALLESDLNFTRGSIRVAGGANVDINREDLYEIFAEGTRIVGAQFTVDNLLHIDVYRGVTRNSERLNERESSLLYDEVVVHVSTSSQFSSPSALTILHVTKLVQDFVPVAMPTATTGGEETVVDAIQAQINALAATYKDLFAGLETQRQTAASEVQTARETFTAEMAKEREVEEERAATRRKELDEREKQLNQTLEEIDARDNTTVRRQLRADIRKALVRRTEVSSLSLAGRLIRIGILFISLMASVGLGWLSYAAYEEGRSGYRFDTARIPSNMPPELAKPLLERDYKQLTLAETSFWVSVGRSALFGGGSVFFLLYGVSWARRNYDEDVAARRATEQYIFDIDRASWIIETVMETDGRQKAKLPKAWIEGVCRNLFSNPEGGSDGKDIAPNALAELLRSAAKFKVGPDGAEFETRTRGARRLAGKLDDNG